VISLELARCLRDAGLRWEPGDGDRFVVPDRGMDDQVFTISGMTVDVREVAGGPIIAFNGTVEWALDSITKGEVVWLPREAQLRDALGERFRALRRDGGAYVCEFDLSAGNEALSVQADDAASAYGRALLRVLHARLDDDLAELAGRRGGRPDLVG
jgi:hypothetical protein